jgi:hypothetical protein
MVARIDSLTEEHKARMPEWARKWIAIGLTTGQADRPKFEAAVRECYACASLDPPKAIVWVPSPIVGALAFPIAAYILGLTDQLQSGRAIPIALSSAVRSAVESAVGSAVRSAVESAVRSAVGSAVRSAVDSAVDSEVGSAVESAVRSAVGPAVVSAVGSAVDSEVGSAVESAVGSAVHSAVYSAVRSAPPVTSELARIIDKSVKSVVSQLWGKSFAGQFGVGWYYYWGSPAFVSFFREVCGLDISPPIARAANAYRATCESACWWWPHRDFVMVCERPAWIDRDDRGRLHSTTRAAIAWADGWGLHRVHGAEVPAYVVEHPEAITVARIEAEQNAEVRRIMVERYGESRYLEDCGAALVHEDEFGRLYRRELAGDEPLVMVRVENSTTEPDGSRKVYWLRVHPELRPLHRSTPGERHQLGKPQKLTARNAVASTFGLRGEEYAPVVQT